MMNEKHQFIIPAIIFTIAVSIVGGFFVTQAQVAWLRSATVSGEPALKTDGRAEIAGGAILNTAGATNGLLVPNGNVGIPSTMAGYKLNVEGASGVNSAVRGGGL